MISLLAAAVLAVGQGATDRKVELPEAGGKPPRLVYTVRGDRLDPPKLCPKRFGDPPMRWEFDWEVDGLGTVGGLGDLTLVHRFRVFSQERKEQGDKAPMVARMALRMWDYNMRRLKLDHKLSVNRGLVDYYLCWGGKAGGEQLLDSENRALVNTIYIYDLKSFTGPVEMAREVAHEYGHASLPAVGGFETPEDWANGFLGERLFLRYLRNEIAAGRLTPEDAMGADAKSLDAWVRSNVDPLVTAAALNPPNKAFMDGRGKPSMDAYMGLALYAEAILPPSVFGRSLRLTGSDKAGDYVDAVVLATEEPERVVLDIPPMLAGKTIWVPLGEGTVKGAMIQKRQSGWAQIKPTIGAIILIPKGH